MSQNLRRDIYSVISEHSPNFTCVSCKNTASRGLKSGVINICEYCALINCENNHIPSHHAVVNESKKAFRSLKCNFCRTDNFCVCFSCGKNVSHLRDMRLVMPLQGYNYLTKNINIIYNDKRVVCNKCSNLQYGIFTHTYTGNIDKSRKIKILVEADFGTSRLPFKSFDIVPYYSIYDNFLNYEWMYNYTMEAEGDYADGSTDNKITIKRRYINLENA